MASNPHSASSTLAINIYTGPLPPAPHPHPHPHPPSLGNNGPRRGAVLPEDRGDVGGVRRRHEPLTMRVPRIIVARSAPAAPPGSRRGPRLGAGPLPAALHGRPRSQSAAGAGRQRRRGRTWADLRAGGGGVSVAAGPNAESGQRGDSVTPNCRSAADGGESPDDARSSRGTVPGSAAAVTAARQ